MLIQDRYASSIRSSDLSSEVRSTYSDSDVLGAFGLAAKAYPLAVALQRLFLGDNKAAHDCTMELAGLAGSRARHLRVDLKPRQAVDMAKACLAWHRHSACRACGGHGYKVIPGTKTIGDEECKSCLGTGKRPFEKEFHASFREVAAYLVAEMERAQARAGGAALKCIAPSLTLDA